MIGLHFFFKWMRKSLFLFCWEWGVTSQQSQVKRFWYSKPKRFAITGIGHSLLLLVIFEESFFVDYFHQDACTSMGLATATCHTSLCPVDLKLLHSALCMRRNPRFMRLNKTLVQKSVEIHFPLSRKRSSSSLLQRVLPAIPGAPPPYHREQLNLCCKRLSDAWVSFHRHSCKGGFWSIRPAGSFPERTRILEGRIIPPAAAHAIKSRAKKP